MLAVALVLSAAAGHTLSAAETDVIAAIAAIAAIGLGLQNAIVRRLAVPDLTTTVLTMALTGIAADALVRDRRAAVVRRGVAVLAMLIGALAGAQLVIHAGRTSGLAVAVGLVAVVAVAATLTTRGDKAWHSSTAR
jgi:hypothetical protein